MNYSIWDNLENVIESKKDNEKHATGRKNESLTSRSTSPLPGTPPERKSPQNASESRIEAIFDEAKFWQQNEAIIASIPVENIIPLKLGLIEEYILQGLRSGADRTALFMAAALGVSIANNDAVFFQEVKTAIAK